MAAPVWLGSGAWSVGRDGTAGMGGREIGAKGCCTGGGGDGVCSGPTSGGVVIMSASSDGAGSQGGGAGDCCGAGQGWSHSSTVWFPLQIVPLLRIRGHW